MEGPSANKTYVSQYTATFLRPSGLHRIDFAAANVKIERNRKYLSFQVVIPKKRRRGRRIVKTFRVYSHHDPSLCPVATFQSVGDCLAHLAPPPKAISFFVNINMTTQIVKEPHVNIRSLASSVALRAGIDLDDIVILGNWSSSTVFEQHHRREHLTDIDFTNTVLPVTEGEDILHDASSDFDNNL
ncbi:hypothetical protein G6F43_005914 [Rhizopus delemar]|nr:hypothetical protein G6F43_005914 [Rhizopus delemar]